MKINFFKKWWFWVIVVIVVGVVGNVIELTENKNYTFTTNEKEIEGETDIWKERRKLDRECSIEKEVEMLRQCNFTDVECLYSYHKFSVIIAVK